MSRVDDHGVLVTDFVEGIRPGCMFGILGALLGRLHARRRPLTGIFDIWPASDPTAVTEMSSEFGGLTPIHALEFPPAGVLVDNGEYVMRVKANDREADRASPRDGPAP